MTAACPYCRAPFEPGEEIVTCEACATPHHAECYAENSGCTVFGCARAPVDEPPVSVTSSEIAAPVVRIAAAAPLPPTPPPPPRAGSTTWVPPPPWNGADGAPLPAVFVNGTAGTVAPRGLSFGGYNTPVPESAPAAYIPRRSRLTFILLGVLLGAFGGHNFYAGYTKRAVMQLLLTVLSCFFGGVISWIWAIVEVCTVTQDDDGVAFI